MLSDLTDFANEPHRKYSDLEMLKKKIVEIACLFTVLHTMQIIYSLRNYCLVKRAHGT